MLMLMLENEFCICSSHSCLKLGLQLYMYLRAQCSLDATSLGEIIQLAIHPLPNLNLHNNSVMMHRKVDYIHGAKYST